MLISCVAYEDGRKGRIRATLRILDAPVFGEDQAGWREAAE